MKDAYEMIKSVSKSMAKPTVLVPEKMVNWNDKIMFDFGWVLTQPFRNEQDMTQSQFSSWVKLVWIQFSKTLQDAIPCLKNLATILFTNNWGEIDSYLS